MAALGRGFSVPTGPQATCGHNRSCVTHSCATDGANDDRHRPEGSPQGRVVTAETATFAAPAARAERTAQFRVVAGWLWSGALLAVLAFLVLYPVAMLLLGALTNTNPVVDGFGVFDLSLGNFITVLGNPNVHHALANSLIACGGGTALAVASGSPSRGSWCAPTRRGRISSAARA